MSDVVLSTTESVTTVTVVDDVVQVAVTTTPVQVSTSTAGVQGASYAKGDPIYERVRNSTGQTLLKGQIVYLSGATGNHVNVELALASGDNTSARTIGWVSEDIPVNTDGFVMMFGYLEGLDTSSVPTVGQILYLSPTVPGGFTATKPSAPDHLVYVGICVRKNANNGVVSVHIQNGYELEELHNVSISNPVNNQVLTYDSATDLWKNATNPADGVTSITATAPLTGGTITSTGSIGLDQTALSIAQSQVTNLTTDLASKANLAGGNAFTGAQTITSTDAGQFPLSIISASGQTASTFRVRNSANNADLMSVDSSGQIRTSTVLNPNTFNNSRLSMRDDGIRIDTGVAGNIPLTLLNTNALPTGDIFRATGTAGNFQITSSGAVRSAINTNNSFGGGTSANNILRISTNVAGNIGLLVDGSASQTADLQQWRNSASSVLARINSSGEFFNTFGIMIGNAANYGATLNVLTQGAGNIGGVIRGAANQVEDLLELQASAGTVLGGRNANAQIYTGSTAAIQTAVGAGINGVTGNGTTVTFSTTNAHGLANGDRVTIAGLTPSGYNGTYIISGVSTFSFNIANTTTGTATGSGTVSVDAQTSITARSAGTIPLIVRGTSGQATNLFEARDSSNNVAAWITSSGTFTSTQSTGFSIVGATFYGTLNSGQTARIQAGGSVGANPHVVVRGVAGATGNLQEWQNSAGTILASINSTGGLNLTSRLLSTANSAASVPIISRGVASQTGNLQEWQNDAGSILARIASTGQFVSASSVTGSTVETTSNLSSIREGFSGGMLQMVRATAAQNNPGANIGRIYFRDGTNAGTLRLVVRAGASGAETTILDNIPQ